MPFEHDKLCEMHESPHGFEFPVQVRQHPDDGDPLPPPAPHPRPRSASARIQTFMA
jgi:hypothetical protein